METAATRAKEQEQIQVAIPVQQNSVPGGEPNAQQEIGGTVWDFLQSQPGQAIVQQLLGMLHAIQKSTIEANADANKQQLTNTAEQQKQQIEFQHRTLHFWMWIQGIVFASCLISTVVLAWHDKMSGTAATVICTTLGYLFGRNAKN